MTSAIAARALLAALAVTGVAGLPAGLAAQRAIAAAPHSFATSISQVLTIRRASNPVFAGGAATTSLQVGGNVEHQVRVRLGAAPAGAVVMVRDVSGTFRRVTPDADVVVAVAGAGMRTLELAWHADGLHGTAVEVNFSVLPAGMMVASSATITAR